MRWFKRFLAWHRANYNPCWLLHCWHYTGEVHIPTKCRRGNVDMGSNLRLTYICCTCGKHGEGRYYPQY